MNWTEAPFLAFDLETTGVDVEAARIVTASIAIIRPGEPPEARNWLINPGVEIPESASKVHGITTERAAAEGMTPRAGVEEIADLLLSKGFKAGLPVVIMNAPFDLTILDREARRHGLPPLDPSECRPVIDPFVIDRELDKWRPGSRTLTSLCEHYGVKLDGAHSADGDSMATARVAWKLAKKYSRQVGFVDLRNLHAQQAGWHAERSLDFASYLRDEAKDTAAILGTFLTDPIDAEQVRQSLVAGGRKCNAKKATRIAKRIKDSAEGEDIVADLLAQADGVDTSWPIRPWAGVAS